MIVVRGIERWPYAPKGLVCTLGNFDGVHRGHTALVRATRALAAEHHTMSAVITFDPAPRDVLRPGNGIPRIQSLDRKLLHLERAGIDATIVEPFDAALAALSPEAFAQRLSEKLGIVAAAVGHDFRFGHKRMGTPETLRQVLGIEVREIEALNDDGGPISSSRVREALSTGDVARATRLLGRPHELVGRVIPGDQRGRTLGFPTANLWPEGGLLPPNGVYAVLVSLRGATYRGVANLGTRPTVDATAQHSRLEIYLIDYEGPEFYGEDLSVGLIARIREEQRFPSLDALKAQIASDVREAQRHLGEPAAP